MISKFGAPYMLLLHMAAQKLHAMINSSYKSDSGCDRKTFQIKIFSAVRFSPVGGFGAQSHISRPLWAL